MKKLFLVVIIFLLSLSLFGCMADSLNENKAQPEENQQSSEIDEEAVRSLVENFGSSLQKVSLQGPGDIVEKSMQENYSDFLSPELLQKLINDPQNAPGKLTSSPWPDRIEILSIEKTSEDTYKVDGEVIEITSVEKENGGVAARKPINLVVDKTGERWLINSVHLGPYEDKNLIVYKSTHYGFSFPLPESWENYTIVTGEWEGLGLKDSQDGEVIETGPMISIRHPQWTSEDQRQDIPIMVFTLTQWNALQQEEFHIGAAPIGPKELGRNSKYVFALPARYNFAFPTGYEEVENILESNPLQAE